jgi:protoporphyrinogen oxidase
MRSLLGDQLILVPRRTRIYFRGRYFGYPLKPTRALFGMGPAVAVRMLADYAAARLSAGREAPGSFEEWTVRQFGRTLYELYLKSYTEKVWGIPCDSISLDWASQRIRGLSLGSAVLSAVLKRRMRGKIKSLVDQFMYPATGAGLTYETMRSAVEVRNQVLTNARVVALGREGRRITHAVVLRRPKALGTSRETSSFRASL